MSARGAVQRPGASKELHGESPRKVEPTAVPTPAGIPEELYTAITGPGYDLEAITAAFRGFLDPLGQHQQQVGAAVRQVTKRELWGRGGIVATADQSERIRNAHSALISLQYAILEDLERAVKQLARAHHTLFLHQYGFPGSRDADRWLRRAETAILGGRRRRPERQERTSVPRSGGRARARARTGG